jgi:hypothetical protein
LVKRTPPLVQSSALSREEERPGHPFGELVAHVLLLLSCFAFTNIFLPMLFFFVNSFWLWSEATS